MPIRYRGCLKGQTESPSGWFRPSNRRALVTLFLSIALLSSSSPAATLSEARQSFHKGDYAACIEACTTGTETNRWLDDWWLLKIRAELTTGQYAEALKTYEASQRVHIFSLPLKWLGVEVLRRNNRPDDALAAINTIRDLADRSPRRLEEVATRVSVGRAVLEAGGDARLVLDKYLEPAKKDDPASPLPYLAIGDLALTKHDYALAAEAFAGALKRSPEDPDAHFGLALAYQESDGEKATALLNKALELNPKHVDSMLFQADNLIDREGYGPAGVLLEKVAEINPKHPKLWAYRAVLAHLTGDRKAEGAHRSEALSTWPADPSVDHLIGLKLSQKYRFAEGEWYQRQSLTLAPDYRPANVQLCQDLLRLGKDAEGWKRAAEALEADPYDVVAYNLITLNDVLATYRTLENEHFKLRMTPQEADIYGDRAMRLLIRAKKELGERYGVDINDKVAIEVFPKTSDFAIRTFGLPGGTGFLGVCFGPVITVNSPASRMARPANWEAVLWHEFCHTVTLHKTKNKMPRWLSEGISVHEERRRNPAWGQSMSPPYRELILAGGATPVSQLSGAFLRPESPMHLQFAYYQSSMVVQYVVDRFGEKALAAVLADLANDVPINTALAKHTEPIEKLDEQFAKWFKELAEQLGTKGVDWSRPEAPLDAGSAAMAAWNKEHPNSFFGLLGEGRALLAEQKYAQAKAPLKRAIELWPTCGDAGSPYLLLAAVHRALNETTDERAMLQKHASLDADAIEPRLRLAEIATAAKDWKAVQATAEEILAINPLIPAPHRLLAQSAEALSNRPLAIEAHRTLLLLDPVEKATHHFHLAQLLLQEKQVDSARNHVIRALEEAPRYREAHKLLLEIQAKQVSTGE